MSKLSELVRAQNVKCLEEALNHKDEPIDTSDPDCGDVTALHVACRGGYPEMVKLLLKHGADMFALTRLNKTPAGLMLMMAEDLAQRDDNGKQQDYLDCLALLLAQDRVRRAQGLASLLGDRGCGKESLQAFINDRLRLDSPPHPIYFKFKKMVEEHVHEARLEAEAKSMHRMKAHSPSAWSFKQLFSSLYRLVGESPQISKPTTYHPQEETKPLLKKMQ